MAESKTLPLAVLMVAPRTQGLQNQLESLSIARTGVTLQAYLLGRMKAPMFDNRGLLRLHVGQQTYTLLLFHKSRFRSFLRPTHGAYRELQLSYPADVVAGAHDHQFGFEAFDNYRLAREAGDSFGGLTYLIKTGAYQDGQLGWRYFHNGGRPVVPVVTFWPDQRRMDIRFALRPQGQADQGAQERAEQRAAPDTEHELEVCDARTGATGGQGCHEADGQRHEDQGRHL